jgi:hypothetical protein
MDRLIKDEIIENIDLSDLEQCIDCIKGNTLRQLRKVQLGAQMY